MIKILLLLLLSFNCLAEELNECGMTKTEFYESDIRCFEVTDGKVVESHFTMDNPESKISFNIITPEELETDYEKVD